MVRGLRPGKNPRRNQHDEPAGDELKDDKKSEPVIQIDYGYTFTRLRAELADGETRAGDDQGQPDGQEGGDPEGQGEAREGGAVDLRDQYGLCLLAAETTTGWVSAIPVLEKGASSLKRVAEQLVRLSMQVSPGGTVVLQSDTEPSAKQVVNAVCACRAKLGLKTETRWISKASHGSNGQVEKGLDTVRRNALTLRAFAEDRVRGKIEGHHHVYPWFMRHAAFLYNRFAVGARGATPYEILYGRKYKGALVPLCEQVIFHKPSRHKGDLQWAKGLWLGVNERNNAHIVGTADGTYESRSVRRLPEDQKWSLEMVLGMKGFPWGYMGTSRRRRPLYTGARASVPLLPDNATLEQIAQAAGKAAAASIAAQTPKPPMDEAGTDPSSSSSSTSTSPRAAPSSREQQEQRDLPQPLGRELNRGNSPNNGSQQPQQERRDLPQPSGVDVSSRSGPQVPVAMDVGVERTSHQQSRPEPVGEVNPKRPRLLLDRPRPGEPGASPSASPPGPLYPPGFAGVRAVTGDIGADELAGFDNWEPEMHATMEEESELAGEYFDAVWDGEGDHPPELSEAELAKVDADADATEIKRLMDMGVARMPREGERIDEYQSLTTKVVRDWRKRPTWKRRSRLVGREFKTLSPYTQELFAPASTLSAIHGFMAVALSRGQELCTFDFKDAYLQVDQPVPMIIEVNAAMFGQGQEGTVTLVLDKLLPGQRIGASAWYNFAKDLLGTGGFTNFPKEPTLFKKDTAGLVLHADDGLVASSRAEREELKKVLTNKVQVEFSEPMVVAGDELNFLKRKYIRTQTGIAVYSNGRYLEALLKSLGKELKGRDSPADTSFLDVDNSAELNAKEAKEYREAVGRLLYLSHTRPDIQFGVCILSSKMSSPTKAGQKWLRRVVGYLAQTPEIGFLIKPIENGRTFDFEGYGALGFPGGTITVESITDADWAGCRRTRRSRTAAHLYVGGSLMTSFVRTQRSIALSSGESEFVALVAGAAEAIYLSDCIRFLVGEDCKVETRARTDSAACKGISQRLGCGRIRHLQCGLLWVQQAVKDSILAVSTIPGSQNPSDIGTKPLGGPRVRELLYSMGALLPDGQPYGQPDKERADEKRAVAKLLKECKSHANAESVAGIGNLMPILLLMAQVRGSQGLSWAAPMVAWWDAEGFYSLVATAGIGLVTLVVFLGIPLTMLRILKWCLGMIRHENKVARKAAVEKEAQTDEASKVHSAAMPGRTHKSREERLTQQLREHERFAQEYVERCNTWSSFLVKGAVRRGRWSEP